MQVALEAALAVDPQAISIELIKLAGLRINGNLAAGVPLAPGEHQIMVIGHAGSKSESVTVTVVVKAPAPEPEPVEVVAAGTGVRHSADGIQWSVGDTGTISISFTGMS